jgi:hypothetical protein
MLPAISANRRSRNRLISPFQSTSQAASSDPEWCWRRVPFAIAVREKPPTEG